MLLLAVCCPAGSRLWSSQRLLLCTVCAHMPRGFIYTSHRLSFLVRGWLWPGQFCTVAPNIRDTAQHTIMAGFFVVVVVAVFASHHSTHSWSVVCHVFGNVLQRFYWFNVTTQNIHGERERQEQDRKKQCNLIRKTYACSLGVCMSTSIQIVELSPSVWGIFFFSSFIAVRFTWHCEKSPTLLVCHHSGIAETRFTTLSVYCNSLFLATDKLLWFLDFGGNFLQREQ